MDVPAHFAAHWPVPRRITVPRAGGELQLLGAYLDHARESVELKCAGLSAAQLSTRGVPPSTMSLHGLVRHLAGVERWWFAINFAGEQLPLLYYSDDDPGQDFDDLAGDPFAALVQWRTECDRSRRIVAAAGDPEALAVLQRDGGFTLRWLLLRMIEEYAQHAGHADLLREALDGAVGH